MSANRSALPRDAVRRRIARSAGLGLASTLLVAQLATGGAVAASGNAGLVVYSSVPRNGPGADRGNSDLWLTSAQGNADRHLTTTPETEGTPAWSPDGRRIAFSRLREDANGVFLGSWLYAIDPSSGAETLLTNGGSFGHSSWSPDGAQLAFSGHSFAPGSDPNANSIFTMPATGGAFTQLTFGQFADAGPTWSPQGDRIAFSSDRGGPGSQLWLMNADGTDLHEIATGLAYAQSPDWSPDGQWLVVFGVLDGAPAPGVFKVRPDGTDLTQLTSPSVQGINDPTWSPDGQVVLFEAFDPRGTKGQFGSELEVVPASGGPAALFGPGVRHLEGQLSPDWQPLTP